MMIGEENFVHRPHARQPRIQTEKAGEVKMQNFRVISAHNLSQPNSPPASVCRIGNNLQRDIRQVEKAPHLFRRLAEKTKRALPAALAELYGKLARKGFRSADALRGDSKH